MDSTNEDIEALRAFITKNLPEALPLLDRVLALDGGDQVVRLAMLAGHDRTYQKLFPSPKSF